MTQALNLANFANNLNTSGATSNAGLQNSSVTVTAGTGMFGGGSVALGGTVTLTNAAPDQTVVLTSGSGISVTGTYPNFTIATSGGGGVTSLNGQTGAITNTTFNTIGSYTGGYVFGQNAQYLAGSTVAGSSITQLDYGSGAGAMASPLAGNYYTSASFANQGQTGTWRAMGKSRNTQATSKSGGNYTITCNLWVRIS